MWGNYHSTIKTRIMDMEGLLEWLARYYFFTWMVVTKVWLHNNSLLYTFALCTFFLFYFTVKTCLSKESRMNCSSMSHPELPCGCGQLSRRKDDERTGEPPETTSGPSICPAPYGQVQLNCAMSLGQDRVLKSWQRWMEKGPEAVLRKPYLIPWSNFVLWAS